MLLMLVRLTAGAPDSSLLPKAFPEEARAFQEDAASNATLQARWNAQILNLSTLAMVYPARRLREAAGRRWCLTLEGPGLETRPAAPAFDTFTLAMRECDRDSLMQLWSHRSTVKRPLRHLHCPCREAPYQSLGTFAPS